MALTVPLERITQEARRVDVRKGLVALVRLLGTIVLGIPYVIAWCLRTLVLGATLLWIAAVAGWRDAARPRTEGGSGS